MEHNLAEVLALALRVRDMHTQLTQLTHELAVGYHTLNHLTGLDWTADTEKTKAIFGLLSGPNPMEVLYTIIQKAHTVKHASPTKRPNRVQQLWALVQAHPEGITRPDLAAALGIPPNTVARYCLALRSHIEQVGPHYRAIRGVTGCPLWQR